MAAAGSEAEVVPPVAAVVDMGASYFTLTGAPRTPARAGDGSTVAAPHSHAGGHETHGEEEGGGGGGTWGGGLEEGPWTAALSMDGSENDDDVAVATPRHSVAGSRDGGDGGGGGDTETRSAVDSWAGDNVEGIVYPRLDAVAIVALAGGALVPPGAGVALPEARPGSRDVVPALARVASRGRPLSRQELVRYVDPVIPVAGASAPSSRPTTSPYRYDVYHVAGIGETSEQLAGSPYPPPSRGTASRGGGEVARILPARRHNAWEAMAEEAARLVHLLAALGEPTETPGRDGHGRVRVLRERLEVARKALAGKRAARAAVSRAARIAAFVRHRVGGYVTKLVAAFHAHDAGGIIQGLEAGAPPTTVFVSGDTVLMTLLRWNDAAAVARALELGADPNAPNRLGVTPLALAVALGSRSALRALLSSGAVEIGAQCPIGQRSADTGDAPESIGTPVMLAAGLRRAALVKIMSVHASWHPNVNNAVGRTALMYACRYGSRDAANMLLRMGATVAPADDDGHNAIDWLCFAVAEAMVGSGDGGGDDDGEDGDGGDRPPMPHGGIGGPRGNVLPPVAAWKAHLRAMWEDLQAHYALETGVPYVMDESAPLPAAALWPAGELCSAEAVSALPQEVLAAEVAAVATSPSGSSRRGPDSRFEDGGGDDGEAEVAAGGAGGSARVSRTSRSSPPPPSPGAGMAMLRSGMAAAAAASPRSPDVTMPPLHYRHSKSILKKPEGGSAPRASEAPTRRSPPAARSTRLHCAFCTARFATQHCTECLADMCDGCCIAVHRGLPVTELHRVLPLALPPSPAAARGRTGSVMAVVGAAMADMKLAVAAASATARRRQGNWATATTPAVDVAAAVAAATDVVLTCGTDVRASATLEAYFDAQAAPPAAVKEPPPSPSPRAKGSIILPPVARTGSMGSSSARGASESVSSVPSWQRAGAPPPLDVAAPSPSRSRSRSPSRSPSPPPVASPSPPPPSLPGAAAPRHRRGSAAELSVAAAIAASRATTTLAAMHEGAALYAAGEAGSSSSSAPAAVSAVAAATNLQRQLAATSVALQDTAPSVASGGEAPRRASMDGAGSPTRYRRRSSVTLAFMGPLSPFGTGADDVLPHEAAAYAVPVSAPSETPPPAAAQIAAAAWRALADLSTIKLGVTLLAGGKSRDAADALTRTVDTELGQPRRRMEVIVYALLQLALAQAASGMVALATRSLDRAAAAIRLMPEQLRPAAACSVAVTEARVSASKLADPALVAAATRARLLGFLAVPPGATWAALLAYRDDASLAADAVGPALERRKMAVEDVDVANAAVPTVRAAAAGAAGAAAAIAAAVRRTSMPAVSLAAVSVAAAAAASALPPASATAAPTTVTSRRPSLASPLPQSTVARNAATLSATLARAALTIQRWYAGYRTRRWLAATVRRRWVRRLDTATGTPYFLDLHTGATRWELPAFMQPHRIAVSAVCATCATPAGGGTLSTCYCLRCNRGACAACFAANCAPAAHVACRLPPPIAACTACQTEVACQSCATCAAAGRAGAAFCAACIATAHPADHAAATAWLPPLQAAYDAMVAAAAP